jgi:O-antigen ligase
VLTAVLERRIQNLILFALLGMTLLVTPWMSLDPINLPKYLVLVVTGFVLLGNLVPYLKQIWRNESKPILLGSLCFIIALLCVFLFHFGAVDQLHGTYGRNTGLLSYLCLGILLFSVVIVSTRSFTKRILSILLVTGVFNAGYGVIQLLGLDPANWSGPYGNIVGTLGNPNFVSALLGISSIVALSIVFGKLKNVHRLFLILFIMVSILVITESTSNQGLLIFALGSGLVMYFKVFRSRGYLGLLYLLIYCSSIVLGALGVLNKGLFSSYLYQTSVTYRGDYWRAGWNMTIDNPIFGIGLDSYGDWYRFYRNEAAALRRGPDVTSNSAHNVFLDISSNGGFLLLSAYLLVIGLIFKSAIKILKRSKNYDVVGIGLVVSWLAYLIQSVISINQLGLAIWGWVLGGAIIGYDIHYERVETPKIKRVPRKRPEQVPANVVITGSLGLVIGVLISIWPLVQDVSFRTALQSGDATRIVAAVNRYPGNTYFFNYAGDVLLRNNLGDQALELARKSIEMNPRDFNGWKLLISNPKLDEVELEKAIAEMKRLDPFNNTLGQK